MANLRNLKKEIDYRLEEVVFDCDMAICFQPSKEKEVFEVMQEAVAVRNDLFTKANNPAEPEIILQKAQHPRRAAQPFARPQAFRRSARRDGGGL